MANGNDRQGLQTTEGKLATISAAFVAVLNALAAFNVVHWDEATRNLIVQASTQALSLIAGLYAIGRGIAKLGK